MWKMHYGWTSFDGTPLIRYRPAATLSINTHRIDLLDGKPLTETRLILTILGGYLLALTQDDLAAVTITAGS